MIDLAKKVMYLSECLKITELGGNMKNILVVVVASVGLSGCNQTSGGAGANAFANAFLTGFASGLTGVTVPMGTGVSSGISGSLGGSAANLPDTPQCRRYLNFARGSGAPGTYSPLIQHYNACMESARNNPRVQSYRCAPGTYLHWVGSQAICSRK